MGFETKKIIKAMDASVVGPSEVSKEYTLKDILADKKRNVLFGEFLKWQKGGENLGASLVEPEKLSVKQLQKLEEVQVEFVNRLEGAKQLREALTPEIFQEIIARSPELMQQVNLGGAESVRKVLLDQMEALAMEKKPDHFNGLKKSLSEAVSVEAKIKQNDVGINEYWQKHNLDMDKLQESFSVLNPQERHKAILNVVHNGLKWYQFSWGTNKKVQKLEKEREEVSALASESAGALDEVAKALAVTLSENKDTRVSLLEAITGQPKKSEVVGSGFKEVVNGIETQEDVEQAWEEYKKVNKKNKGEDDIVYASRIHPDFEADFVNRKVGKKTGFWATIRESFLRGLIGNLSY